MRFLQCTKGTFTQQFKSVHLGLTNGIVNNI